MLKGENVRPIPLCIAVLLVLSVAARAQSSSPNGQGDAHIRPDPRLTPGAVVTSDPEVFCHAGYSRSVRHTSGRVKHEVYWTYEIDRRTGHYEMDHLIPLALGGADVPANLWPEDYDNEWGAEAKDRLEWRLVQLVCGRALDAKQAQRDIATDWIAAYGKYCPNRADCPGYRATHGGVEWFVRDAARTSLCIQNEWQRRPAWIGSKTVRPRPAASSLTQTAQRVFNPRQVLGQGASA